MSVKIFCDHKECGKEDPNALHVRFGTVSEEIETALCRSCFLKVIKGLIGDLSHYTANRMMKKKLGLLGWGD